MEKVRMKVLREFSRNLGGQIITGDPKHPDKAGRIVTVTEAAALVLEADKVAKRYTARDEVADEDAEFDPEVEEHGADDDNLDGASVAGTGATESAQTARERRTDTSGSGKRGVARRKAGKRGTPGARGGAPVGGHETTATTNHPTTAVGGDMQTSGTNAGANEAPDPDAPPTE